MDILGKKEPWLYTTDLNINLKSSYYYKISCKVRICYFKIVCKCKVDKDSNT